jgi:molybdopterin synthase sulfur carrier subunit
VQVTLRLPGALRELAGGRTAVTVEVGEPATVGAVLDRLAADMPVLERRLRDERGEIRRHVNVFVDTRGDAVNVRDAALLATPVPAGSEVVVIPAVSGG